MGSLFICSKLYFLRKTSSLLIAYRMITSAIVRFSVLIIKLFTLVNIIRVVLLKFGCREPLCTSLNSKKKKNIRADDFLTSFYMIETINPYLTLSCLLRFPQGVYGYPIEIQALFFMALRCALSMLKPDNEGKEFIERIVQRLHALSYHMRSYFWIDFQQLNVIYRYKTEEYSHTAVNKFNVIPDSIPDWIFDFMPSRGGYFIGNVSPARMDFRWFALGNCIAILSSLATPEQSMAIMDLIEERWEELVGEMPLKICYPAIESHEWRIVTGCDPKNTRWSYHNGGSWPG